MKLLIILFLISLMGCSGGVSTHQVQETLTIYDGRTLLADDPLYMCYLPQLNAYLNKVRIGDNEADEWNSETITDAVLGFTDLPPDYDLIHSGIPWWEWDFYHLAYRNGYPLSFYFDENMIPVTTRQGTWATDEWLSNPPVAIRVEDYGKDEYNRVWVIITITYYTE